MERILYKKKGMAGSVGLLCLGLFLPVLSVPPLSGKTKARFPQGRRAFGPSRVILVEDEDGRALPGTRVSLWGRGPALLGKALAGPLGKPLALTLHYLGPPLALVRGRVKGPPEKGDRARLEFRGTNGNWYARVGPTGEIRSIRLPAGGYKLLWFRGPAVSVLRESLVIGPEGRVLDEEVPLLEKEILFLGADGAPQGNLEVTVRVRDSRGKPLRGGYLPCSGGIVRIQGSPETLWILQVKGRKTPGEKRLLAVPLFPGGKKIEKVRLPW